MSSSSEPSMKSPISKLSYDVLREIFVHCLPRYPFKHKQPDTTIAPMLLCQVCSSWRMVALTSTTLWSHLSSSFTIKEIDDSQDWTFGKNEIEFLRWWKRNQGPMAPFLGLNVNFKWGKMDQEHRLDETKFFLDYLTSAQYLQLDTAYWGLIQKRIENGFQFSCPNLHTLVKYGWPDDDDTFPFYETQALSGHGPNRPPSALLHLAIRDDMLPPYNVSIPAHWSTLTHLSLDNVEISFTFWFALIRAVPDLQWGYFDIAKVDGMEGYIRTTKQTHLHLSTLFISVREVACPVEIEFPLGVLFFNLHLPSLHTLSLYSFEDSWRDDRAVEELYAVLQSTPAVTTLELRGTFFSLEQRDFHTDMLELVGDIKPVWRHATQLVHLQLELPATGASGDRSATAGAKLEDLDVFIRNAFCDSSKWLGLDNPACPIQKITLVDDWSQGALFKRVRTYMMSSIRKDVQAPNVTFQVTSQSLDQAASELWMEWGSIEASRA